MAGGEREKWSAHFAEVGLDMSWVAAWFRNIKVQNKFSLVFPIQAIPGRAVISPADW
jgi:hypothetical protein